MKKKTHTNKRPDIETQLRNLEDGVKFIMPYSSDEEIFAYVNMILKGWIKKGKFTDQYRALAAKAIEQRHWTKTEEEELRKHPLKIVKSDEKYVAPTQIAVLVDTSNFSIK